MSALLRGLFSAKCTLEALEVRVLAARALIPATPSRGELCAAWNRSLRRLFVKPVEVHGRVRHPSRERGESRPDVTMFYDRAGAYTGPALSVEKTRFTATEHTVDSIRLAGIPMLQPPPPPH